MARKAQARNIPVPPGGGDARPGDIISIRKSLLSTQSELVRFQRAFDTAMERVSEVYEWKKENEALDIDAIRNEFANQFEKINSAIKTSLSKNNELRENMEIELKTLKALMGQSEAFERQAKEVDLKGMRRDMEAVKTKLQFLERHMENMDLKGVIEKLGELEDKLKGLRSGTPVIIE
ncbi:MAG: hypothetical protein HY367_01900 [Candidatus Aenigmarchaeota archaeon]|nr:hypothetical protein [Candidatus Aenigmarchaeota archaeon]